VESPRSDDAQQARTEVTVVAGLSGAGRSTLANTLEDLNWFVIDNLPPSLIPKVADLAAVPGSAIARLGLVVGTEKYHEDLMPALDELRESGAVVRIVFLEARDDVLLRRYDDTRRRHPLGDSGSVLDAIAAERALLDPVKAEADLVIDTTEMTVHDLKAEVVSWFKDPDSDGLMRTTVMSFGYKHGAPAEADLVFDCRFLPNPHWVAELRPKSGLDDLVRGYVLNKPSTMEFLQRLLPLIDMLLPAYAREGKSYLTVAMGCTGGRHRSVALAEELGRLIRARGFNLRVRHRDIDR